MQFKNIVNYWATIAANYYELRHPEGCQIFTLWNTSSLSDGITTFRSEQISRKNILKMAGRGLLNSWPILILVRTELSDLLGNCRSLKDGRRRWSLKDNSAKFATKSHCLLFDFPHTRHIQFVHDSSNLQNLYPCRKISFRFVLFLFYQLNLSSSNIAWALYPSFPCLYDPHYHRNHWHPMINIYSARRTN